ncbi:hypothetical protein, partial [Romboutsia sp.]|uniref:hypothetical protein n=1 Tax=Romboutsia sp. TaxID=1965302 RepID=UPI002B71230C
MNDFFRGYIPYYYFQYQLFKTYSNKDQFKCKRDTLRMLLRLNQQEYNEKYFRPSKFPAINIKDLDEIILKYSKDDSTEISLPPDLIDTSENTIINFFSILREANQGAHAEVGCGTIGMEKLPYPIAYQFLSKDLQSQISYEQFLKLYNNIFHINLIKMVKLPEKNHQNDVITFLVEFETIQGTCFCYYYGYYTVQKENGQYKIKNFEFFQEDFLCAPYHYWQHNAEMKVEIMYGNWCKLIKKQYPTEIEGFLKKILIDGMDGNTYLFTFVELT